MINVVVEWNDMRRYLALPGVPDKGDTLVIPSAKPADPEHGLVLTVATRRWRCSRTGNLDQVTLKTLGGPQPPRPLKDEEERFRAEWTAAGWIAGEP